MALLDICRIIRPQCDSILPLPPYIDSTLVYLPGDLARYGSPPSTITLSWYLSDGSRDDFQHDCFRLRSSLGWRGHQACTCSPSYKYASQDSDMTRPGHCGGLTL